MRADANPALLRAVQRRLPVPRVPGLVGQRHFRVESKHAAQASEYFTPKRTCLRCVLVFSQIDTKVALSN
jgi:hypothetical protein